MKDILSVKTAIIKKRTLKQIVHSLFFIMFRNYALVVVAFAILTGLIFVQLYSRSAIEANQKLLLKQAESIAKRVGVFVDDDDEITYPSYLEVLEELETTDIWIISNPKSTSPMPKKYTNIDISKETQLEISSLFDTVFSKLEKIQRQAMLEKIKKAEAQLVSLEDELNLFLTREQ